MNATGQLYSRSPVVESRSEIIRFLFHFRNSGNIPLMNLDQDRVPARLEDALILLDSALTQTEKDAWHSMTAAKMFDLQAQIARVLRSKWSLLDPQTPIRIYFRELGLDDPEEVSLLLIDAYWRKHNNEPVPVEELVREYLEE